MTNPNLIFLRVKIKSLTAEARIIRAETAKAKKHKQWDLLNSLTAHRKVPLRAAARETFLAYGYLRGKPYRTMEATNRDVPWLRGVIKMISKYGHPTDEDTIRAWAGKVKVGDAQDEKVASEEA